MTFSRLRTFDFTIALPTTSRIAKAIPITRSTQLLIFKDRVYWLFDFVTQTKLNEGRLPFLPNRYMSISTSILLLVCQQSIIWFDTSGQTSFKEHNIQLFDNFSKLLYFEGMNLLVEIREKPSGRIVQLIGHSLITDAQTCRFELGTMFTAPQFIKISDAKPLFLVLQQEKTGQTWRLMSFTENLHSIQVLDKGTLELPDNDTLVVRAFLEENHLLLFCSTKGQAQLIKYNLETRKVDLQHKLFDKNSLLLQVLGRFHDGTFVYIRATANNHYLECMKGDTSWTDTVKLEGRASFYHISIALTADAVFFLEPQNQKFFEKQREEVPTLLKFRAVRQINKKSIYVTLILAMMKHHADDHLVHSVLDCLAD